MRAAIGKIYSGTAKLSNVSIAAIQLPKGVSHPDDSRLKYILSSRPETRNPRPMLIRIDREGLFYLTFVQSFRR